MRNCSEMCSTNIFPLYPEATCTLFDQTFEHGFMNITISLTFSLKLCYWAQSCCYVIENMVRSEIPSIVQPEIC